ncbi:MAG: PBP1A family penicillin-binding protein [Candidatus Sumerlaeaceae bacterium]|nr:PBP1A family penicillin-binding protein [Candidatus Sumerlaeaceae bacterium]
MHPFFRKILVIFASFLLLGSAAAGVALGGFLAYLENLPPLDVLDNYSPPEVTRIFDRTGNSQLAEIVLNAERREVVRVEDVPEHVRNAFIAIEDERFFKHFGVDAEGVVRAIVENLRGSSRPQGASTITMQVARNIVLNDRSRRWSRKIKETLIALQMERRYSKNQILEFYMNHIFFGEQAYGVQEAARTYFNKSVKDLTVPEAAMIAGIPQAPSRLSPLQDAERTRERRNLVLRNMRKLGFIASDEELERYLATPIELNQAPRPRTAVPYFVDYTRWHLRQRASGRQQTDLAGGGYTIISTVDLNLQRIVEEELSKGLRSVEKEIESQKPERFGIEASELGSVRKRQARLARIKEVKEKSITVTLQGYTGEVPLPKTLPYFNPQEVLKPGGLVDIYIQDIKGRTLEAYLYDKTHVQGAAVLLDVRTGEVLALAGGDDFSDTANNGQWNRAIQGGRQPGSCWKPLLYAAALDLDDSSGKPRFTPGTVLMDEPLTLSGYTPKNYEGRFYGPTSLYEGLVKSRNIPTIRLFLDIGAKRAVPLYHKFNMVTIPSDWELDPVPSMPLGTPNITPLELTAAYAVIANGGIGIEPSPVKRLYSAKNPNETRIERPAKHQVLSPQAAFMATKIMQDVVNMGTAKTTVGKWVAEQTAKGRKIPQVAGKTGTTNDCYVAWFVGFTPDLALGIYVGYDQHRTMGPKMVGGRTVGPIWVPMMDRILQTRDDWRLKFEAPNGLAYCDMCSKSGKLATSACYASGNSVFKNVAFKAGSEPKSSCTYHSSYAGYEGSSEEDVEGGYFTGRGASVGQPGDPLPQGYQYYW